MADQQCKTEAQRQEMDRLIALGKTVYLMKTQGKGVVDQFRRYVEKRDPEQIGEGLYHILIQGAGGFNDIAHFNLYGFRDVYPHPAIMVEQLILPEIERYPRQGPDAGHSFYVYTDGMHAGQVAWKIVEISLAHREELALDFLSLRRAADEAEFRRLAVKLGVTVPLDNA